MVTLPKKFELDTIIHLIKNDFTKKQIRNKLNISKTQLSYYLRRLEDLGHIKRIGKYEIRLLRSSKSYPQGTNNEVQINTKKFELQRAKKQIRGHAFIWKIKTENKINWENRLKESKIKYKLIGTNKSIPRIIFQNKKIWLTKEGMIIYEPESFFSNSSFTSKGMAVYLLDKTIKELGRHLKIDFRGYMFSTSREHYSIIKNELAKQYNKNKEKLEIYDDGKKWMWVDNSHSLQEMETNNPKDNREVQIWYNDMKKTNWKATPSFLIENINNNANQINKITNYNIQYQKQMKEFATALNKHIPAYERMGDITLTLLKEIKHLRKEINKINH